MHVVVISIHQRRRVLVPVILLIIDIIPQYRDQCAVLMLHLPIELGEVCVGEFFLLRSILKTNWSNLGANCGPLRVDREIGIFY